MREIVRRADFGGARTCQCQLVENGNSGLPSVGGECSLSEEAFSLSA